MKWTSTIAIALVPAITGAVACSDRDAHAGATGGEGGSEASSQVPPPPDADATSRKPLQPKAAETPPSAPTQLEIPPVENQPPPVVPPSPGAPAAADQESLLSDEDAAIPTQEEADQEAALSITEENADAEPREAGEGAAEAGGG